MTVRNAPDRVPERTLFLHYLDGEFDHLVGPSNARAFVSRQLKELALVGDCICLGDIMLLDSGALQTQFCDREFRDFLHYCDPKFLQLEVGVQFPNQVATRRELTYTGLERMTRPGWVSSSPIRTEVFRHLAELLLAGSDTEDIVRLIETRLGAPMPTDERSRVAAIHTSLDWFASNDNARVRAKARKSGDYYQKLTEARDTTKNPLHSLLLQRVQQYIDQHVPNEDDRKYRSSVVKALQRDSNTAARFKRDVRATVAAAWSTAVAEHSTATIGSMVGLGAGVPVPLILERPFEVLSTRRNAERVWRPSAVWHSIIGIGVDPASLDWGEVARAVETTSRTRELVRDARTAGDYHEAYSEHIYRLREHFSERAAPRLTNEAVRIALAVGVVSSAGPILGAVPSSSWVLGGAIVGGAGAVTAIADSVTRGSRTSTAVNTWLDHLPKHPPPAGCEDQ